MTDWRTHVADLERSTTRMVETVDRLTNEELRGPSRLPGWTRGHVVAHLARNGDSCWNLLEWARIGVPFPQYPSDAARQAGIQASAHRDAAELRAEIALSVERLDTQIRTLPTQAWDVLVRARSGSGHPAWYTLCRRWREVEVHHVDLDAGHDPRHWSRAYVEWELAETLGALDTPLGRIRAGDIDVTAGDSGPEISGRGYELLGWLTGRVGGSILTVTGELPDPPHWPPPSPQRWRDS